MDIPDPEPVEKGVVGVDLGILRMATLRDGSAVDHPRTLKKALAKLKRLQRHVSRCQKGSAHRKKAVQRSAKARDQGGEHPQRRLASGDQPAGENQVSCRAGRSEGERDAEEPPPGTSPCRCRFL